MKHAVRRIVLMVVILAVVAAAVIGILHWRTKEQSKTRLVLYGNVDIRQVELAFNANERIEKIHVVEGQHVEAGDLLAELTTNRLAPAAANAAAQVERQKSDIVAAQAEARYAELQYEHTLRASKTGAATRQEMDSATAARNATQARLQSAHSSLRALEANLVLVQQQLADARLYAPSRGVIRNRILEPGDMASPAKPVLTLAVTDPLWVRAYVDESDLGKIHPGMSAAVTTDSFPGKTYDGWVGFISPTAEFTPKQVQTPELRTALVYEVRVYVRNASGQLRLGMPATVTIPLHQAATARPAAASAPLATSPGAAP
ncbi:MAG: efflux RND transporter periplasmic adaptor subunit [Planctomycetaceae bacterium]|nr:efflux RND transporter periplasmic adaptor subunit [Planctomycetaceae bacterium]